MAGLSAESEILEPDVDSGAALSSRCSPPPDAETVTSPATISSRSTAAPRRVMSDWSLAELLLGPTPERIGWWGNPRVGGNVREMATKALTQLFATRGTRRCGPRV